MTKKANEIQLSVEERVQLEQLVSKGKHNAREIRRAHTLLLSEKGQTDSQIAELLGVTEQTVVRTRRNWVADKRLTDKAKAPRKRRLDGKQEAFLVALACSDAPDGREEWTMQLLAERMVALEVVEVVSDETIRRILKKTKLSRGSKSSGVSRK